MTPGPPRTVGAFGWMRAFSSFSCVQSRSNLALHAGVCVVASPVQPEHPSVPPSRRISAFVMYRFGRVGAAASATRSAVVQGVHVMLSKAVRDQRSVSGLRRTARVLKAVEPPSTATMCSSEAETLPSQVPGFHRSDNFASWTLGR